MLNISIAEPWLWALRWLLFLVPLAAVIALASKRRDDHRCMVACLFAFLYGAAMIFATHQLAIHAGWWVYGGDTLMLLGIPADILTGGAILFGPVLYMLFPATAPLLIAVPIVFGLHGTLFRSLEPMVVAGDGWWWGICLVFATVHIPALYLARWTELDRQLPLRAALLAVAFGVLAFCLLPTLIMIAMGGHWDIAAIPAWRLVVGIPVLALSFIMGLSAVQMFVLHGDGTPIPLDSTKRLVQTGLYAYVSNPMQLCSAIGWLAIGFMIDSIWVALAAAMAWVFVKGLVRWHHRHDLLVRFPAGWPRYRANVPEWRPRWRPWSAGRAIMSYNEQNKTQNLWIGILQKYHAVDIDYQPAGAGSLTYREPDETRVFFGLVAVGKSLNRINFLCAMVGAGILLLVLPLSYLWQRSRRVLQGASS